MERSIEGGFSTQYCQVSHFATPSCFFIHVFMQSILSIALELHERKASGLAHHRPSGLGESTVFCKETCGTL
jgi:hypothetical protein